MKTYRVECLATCRAFPYLFEATLHISTNKTHRLMDRKFYEDECGGVFEDQHIEMELQIDIARFKHADTIRFHRNAQGRLYVRWPERIADVATAKRIFSVWCAGTAYTTDTGIDFWKIYEDQGRNPAQFLKHMADTYQIITDFEIETDDLTFAAAS